MCIVEAGVTEETPVEMPAISGKYVYYMELMNIVSFIFIWWYLTITLPRLSHCKLTAQWTQCVGAEDPRVSSPPGSSSEPMSPSGQAGQYCLDDFELIRVIGRGSYAKVLMVELKKTKRIYAMKVIKKTLVTDDEVFFFDIVPADTKQNLSSKK